MYQINFNHPVHIYFIGIGGISMSGLAEILLDEGFRVSGSDIKPSPLTESLEKNKASVFTAKKPPIWQTILMSLFIPALSTKTTRNYCHERAGTPQPYKGRTFRTDDAELRYPYCGQRHPR